jgi:excisionase family DNA binding protein
VLKPYKRYSDVMSTGQVAAAARISQQLVIRLIDAGVLPGWRLPGSRDRRVLRSKLAEWMRENKLPEEFIKELTNAQ